MQLVGSRRYSGALVTREAQRSCLHDTATYREMEIAIRLAQSLETLPPGNQQDEKVSQTS